MARLENWSLTLDPTEVDPYTPPELLNPVIRLQGEVHDHPSFDDGSRVTTSRVIELDLENLREARTKQTTYKLGSPDPEWVKYLGRVGSAYYEHASRML